MTTLTLSRAESVRSPSAHGALVLGPATPPPGPVDLFLIHPYALALDDARLYQLLPYPPLGLLILAALARDLGYRVVLFDGTFSDRLRELPAILDRYPPRIIGVGSWNSYRANTREVLRVAAGRGVPVLVGGPDPSLYPEEYLDAGGNIVVVGEGEATVRELLFRMLGKPERAPSAGRVCVEVASLQDIAGLVFRTDPSAPVIRTAGRARLDGLEDLPLPAYDLAPTQQYLEAWKGRFGYTSLPIMTARGCPFQCTWCARPSFGRTYKQRSVDHVMKELRYLVGTLGIEYIRIVDDTFVIRKEWIEEWSSAVQRSGLTFRYECLARVELLTDPIVRALRDSDCVKVFCGVESGSQRVLDAMKKGTTVAQIEAAGRRLREAGIAFHAYLMFGYPGERHRDVRATMRLLRRLQPDEHSISIAYPMPGTEFYELVHALVSERTWRNRDDAELQFVGEYSALYYRFARAIARRRYAPGHPRGIRERIEGWILEVLFAAVRFRDEVFRPHRGLPLPESHADPARDSG